MENQGETDTGTYREMQNSITPKSMRIIGVAVLVVALALAVAACGSAAQSPPEAPATTAPQATAASAPTEESASQAKAAPKFELTSATGETVSLDSYIGNKNVVVVFYRGFW